MSKKVYRCGWCGLPTKDDGSLLPELNSKEKIEEYLRSNRDSTQIPVAGDCCREREDNSNLITREMAMDAGREYQDGN